MMMGWAFPSRHTGPRRAVGPWGPLGAASWAPARAPQPAGEGRGNGNSMQNIWYKGCFCHSQEFVMGTILSLCNCSLENALFLIKAT